MKESLELLLKIQKLKKIHADYQPEAYSFVLAALDFTVKKFPKSRHVSGEELLEGIRLYALELFGPMVINVFEHWGVKNTLDFGQIVSDLVEAGLLRKQEKDSLNDFENKYDFKKTFVKKFTFSE